jgi:predicted aspartyl protease
MIQGQVDVEGLPALLLAVGGRDWKVIVDTGFNGDIELPESLRASVNPSLIGSSSSELAGGQTVVEALYLVDFPFDGQTVRAEATFSTSNEILLGTHLLRNYRLAVHFPNGTVQLERVV